jgi:2-dehydro-3-deoxy-D-arabinonate dehydratase
VIRTIRFRDPGCGQVHLGVVHEDQVYSVTDLVPSWNDPISVWSACKALHLSPEDAFARIQTGSAKTVPLETLTAAGALLPPVDAEEVWAAGVTYERSREARNAETKLQDSVYDRVYAAERPEIFFKATSRRVVPPGQPLGLRSDSSWMVPEPELAVVISASGDVIGWTLGNDLSSRDIEGENPLYLPQAKVFSRSCSLGPALVWNTGYEIPSEWTITLTIRRGTETAFTGSVSLRQLRRSIEELVSYLCRDNPVPDGTVLMTGTGIVPPDAFTLQPGDIVEIGLQEIGVLCNPIAPPLSSVMAPGSGTAQRPSLMSHCPD